MPLAAGENATGTLEFVRLAAAGIDYLQPSAVKNGITAQWEICRRAEQSGATCVPHSPYFGPGYLATLHILAAKQKEVALERFFCDLGHMPYGDERADRERLGADPRHAGARSRSGRRADALSRMRGNAMQTLSRRQLARRRGRAAGVALARSAAAQDYPQRPVRVIVPYAPGGASDILARLIQPHLERALGQSFVVDNRGGGASQVGTQAIATAAPDGYTIGVIDSAFVINPGLFAGKLPYDTRKDFAPVSLLATTPLVLVVHPSVPAANTRRNWSRWRRQSPARSRSRRPVSAPRSIWRASSSARSPASRSITFRIAAAGLR